MKMKRAAAENPSRSRPSLTQILRLLLVILLVVTLLTLPLSGFLNSHLSRLKHSSSLSEDRRTTAALSLQTAEEGAVLLENQDDALPLQTATEGDVALFGLASLYPVCSDGRSDDHGTLADSLTAAGFSVNEDLLEFYRSLDDTTAEPAASTYTAELLSSARNGADIAVVALSHTTDQTALLTDEELGLLQLAADLDFDKLIVVVNSASVLQLDALQDDAYGIDAVLWIGAPGEDGLTAAGELLSGAVNPSGRTTATYAYDLTSAPAASETDSATVSYNEGIYVGYRYYETRYGDDEDAYAETVQYPFGYGLSYTTFDQTISDFASDGTLVSVKVTVTNTGEVDGATVVQLYAHPPYADGGIETASAVLVGYTRTDTLAPGASETVSVTFPLEYLASYDTENSCYVLQKGSYQIQLQSDAHTELDARTLNIAKRYTYETTAADFSGAAVETVLSRSDWADSEPEEGDSSAEPVSADTSAGETASGQRSVKLRKLAGADYDDPAWSTLLSGLSSDQLASLTVFDGDTLPAVRSIGLAKSRFLDARYGLIGKAHGVRYQGTLLPCASLIGSTWDDDLTGELGAALGQEAQDMGLDGIYGMSGALLRSASYGDACSEDPLLTGSLLSAYGTGVESTGTICLVQDYGVPEDEDVTVLVDEQALRELYLRPFALCLETGSVSGAVTSGGTLGGEDTAAALLQDLPRTEWSFAGMLVSAGDPAQDLTAGASLVISTDGDVTLPAEDVLTEAAHATLYTLANHDPAASKYGPSPVWPIPLAILDVAVLALNVGLFLYQRKKKAA